MTCNNEKWRDQHVTSMGQRKNLSLQQELNLWPSVHRLDPLTIELPRIPDELGCIQGWCMTCLLHTARISISLMILAVCTMHVIYEFCIWSSSPHNTKTSAPSHISVIPYWEVYFDWFSKNPSIGTELYASVHTHLTIKSWLWKNDPLKSAEKD